ncbi:AAA family ATPase [Gaiella sp.]|uniref:AAA family ATPase n=1 Tax=Gaiella sp. TaxID=2663207 RepID=UPI002C0B36EA|nr:adenylate/guanylate cyclase domain-containing protein [Gaiella sp.]HWO80412.1 adenylate/guanylate cyclase domain-containing protein [Gaiella sp.]
MITCGQCGRESPDDFVFCPGCGAALAPVSAREVRKVVTVLFCDLTGSTAIGERTDPEALRALMNRYYDTARGVLERHGGRVEKFVGDAVMAVFGIPVASEDDALRATRAAVELRDVVQELGLDARIGVNTGAVVAGEGDTLVTGDAVNVTARLEQAAGAGEILLGDDSLRLVRDAVTTEPLELTLKGKTGTVSAHRLLQLDTSAVGVARSLERPMVGRERERARLRSDFEDVVATTSCRLFSLIGPAGIGKSRLVADFLEHVDGQATVARGRALSYGEGITYWPLVEMLVQLGIEPSEAIRSSPAETQLATRALLEERAGERPLVLVIDDLHWAEEPMLDLVEHVVDWSRAAPILLLCVARPELLDVKAGWGGGKLNATSVLLEPLPDDEARLLADGLLTDVELDDDTRARILTTADGNPLFLEEMAALAREARGTVDVPPTIRALLQARLDALNDDERVVVERGAVEGQVFHRGAVTALAPATPVVDVPGQLLSLVRKEVVRPDRAVIAGDDAFRFRHLLIRDTAYEALPKAVRAELHERFADWLEANVELVEQDEIVGYHLEQAALYRAELDPGDPAGAAVARRAAECLATAGRAASARGDLHATRNLLRRALALFQDRGDRRRVIPDLVDVLIEERDDVRFEETAALLVELEGGDERDRALATVLRVRDSPDGPLDELLARLDEAEAVLTERRDRMGLARAEHARAWAYWGACRGRDAHEAYLRAQAHIAAVGATILQRDVIFGICLTGVFGGIRADDLIRLLDELDRSAAAAGPLLEATVAAFRARVEYGSGRGGIDAVREAADREIELLEQVGARLALVTARMYERIVVPWVEGDDREVERGARARVEETKMFGTRLFYANALGMWAIALCRVREPERALELVEEARSLASPDDVADQITLDLAEGYARALLGQSAEAQPLIERAAARAETIEMWSPAFDHRYDEAWARKAQGDLEGARRLLTELFEVNAARGFHRIAARYRRDLAALDGSP